MFKRFVKEITQQYTPRWIVLIIDIYLTLQSFILAYIIRFNFNFDTQSLVTLLPFVGLIAFISFLMVGSYKGVIRHTGSKDAHNVFVAVSILAAGLTFFF